MYVNSGTYAPRGWQTPISQDRVIAYAQGKAGIVPGRVKTVEAFTKAYMGLHFVRVERVRGKYEPRACDCKEYHHIGVRCAPRARVPCLTRANGRSAARRR